MQTYSKIADLRRALGAQRVEQRRIGCVMTMGALHAGHCALLDAARDECDVVAATIFVNPTQFGPNEDFERYPRTLESDLELCRQAGCDVVFLPDVDTMYPPGSQTTVSVSDVTNTLEGACRPTHFDGVTTVVLKLLNIVQPDVAYFGQKDYQQCAVIRQMVRDLDVPVDIEVVPTVRDHDGLALSSRNRYLSASERDTALALFRSLNRVSEQVRSGEQDVARIAEDFESQLRQTPGLDLEYAVIADAVTLQPVSERQETLVALVAARVGNTRLIDNMIISTP